TAMAVTASTSENPARRWSFAMVHTGTSSREYNGLAESSAHLFREDILGHPSDSTVALTATGHLIEFETGHIFSAFSIKRRARSRSFSAGTVMRGSSVTPVILNPPLSAFSIVQVPRDWYEAMASFDIWAMLRKVAMTQEATAEEKKCSGVHSPPGPPNSLGTAKGTVTEAPLGWISPRSP